MRQLVRELANSATVILSTHIMQEVNAICDRALILRNGALVLDERLKDLQRSNVLRLRTDPEAAVDELLGSGAASLGEGRWQLTIDGDLDAAAREVAASLVGANAPIYELAPEQRDLETLFREVSEAGEAS